MPSVNCQISNQCDAQHPRQAYQHVAHDMMSEIGCAVQCKTIIGLLFLINVPNTDRFEKLILVLNRDWETVVNSTNIYYSS